MSQNHEHDTKEENLAPFGGSQLSKAAGQLLLRLFGPVTDEAGQFLVDIFRQWRWRRRNFEKIAQRCETQMKAEGIDDGSSTTVSEGDAYRLAEACSFEDDEIIQELWAGLIISAMEPSKENMMTRAFIEILKAIGPVEAGLLLVLSESDRSYPTTQDIQRPTFTAQDLKNLDEEELHKIHNNINQANKIWEDRLKNWEDGLIALADRMYRHFPEDQKELALQNLFRLRCIGLRTGRNLSRNKTRSGLPIGVSGRDAAPTYDAFSETVDYLEWLTLVGTGTGDHKQSPLLNPSPIMQSVSELRFELTYLGKSLVSSCMTNALLQKVVQQAQI